MFDFDGDVVDLQVGLCPAPQGDMFLDVSFDLAGLQFPPDAKLDGLFVHPSGQLSEIWPGATIHRQLCQLADGPVVIGAEQLVDLVFSVNAHPQLEFPV